MPLKKWVSFFLVFAFWAALFAGMAEANGTLTATFLYKDANNITHPLDHAYVYLHVYPQGFPIKEKYFRKAQYVLGPSDANGNISVSVPEGAYKVRITRRAPLTATPTRAQAYGPPNTGDYSLHITGAITVTTNSTVSLGTQYAAVFGPAPAPITVSGQVKNSVGQPLSGWYVHAEVSAIWCPNGAGPRAGAVPALAPTDANGNYTIKLPSAGTYYFYAAAPGFYDTYSAREASTCSAYVCVAIGSPCSCSYYNCPTTVNNSMTGVNITF